ncbi:cytidylate kinase [Macroventuria anomochaeta]|uniref:Cytidylate kinase n=1 Tax=Macroventuria anomochaeta TaxID=301207 RepID=A0ACB6SFA9_9PLEO|nr:cytidylate kinase [Macroventuria anomochaeta]KAF2633000.1 cytidylate kinase [Macroventuria anomochaeta]
MQFFFLELIERLKNTVRKGWVLRGVRHPESVSDHMYRMAIMCLMVPDIDDFVRTRAVTMSLVHDMGEALIGDITPSDGVSKEQKFEREEMALKFLACTIRSSNPSFADSILDLWYEYERGESPAAMLVREIDKLECIQQANVYEGRSGTDLGEFMALKEKVTLPVLQPLLNDCLHEHEEFTKRTKTRLVVIFLIVPGGPGVGKGTQCSLLAEEFGLHHISVGDLLRVEAARPESPYRDFIPESIRKSILLPAQLTTQLLQQAIVQARSQEKHNFLLDGFPRSIAQVVDFEDKISNDYATISLTCTETELLNRLRNRSSLSERIDDNPESIVRRLQTFNANNAEVLGHLRKQGQCFDVECSGSVSEVYTDVRETVQQILRISESAPKTGPN